VSESAVKMAAYGEYLETYQGIREKHDPGYSKCVHADHCYIHHVDEPYTNDVYRVCGECHHVFVTEEDLQRERMVIMTQIWQDGVRRRVNEPGNEPVDHGDAPVNVPGSEIFHCPLCAHDF
jgi:hypothetical protein